MAEKYGTSLKWVNSDKINRVFELKDGEITVATLRFDSPTGPRARYMIDGQEYAIMRSGLWTPKTTVRKAGSDKDVMTYKPTWATWAGKDTLTTDGGKRYIWKRAGGKALKWTFFEEGARNAIEFRPKGKLDLECDVMVPPDAAVTGQVLLMAAVGWYVIMRLYETTLTTENVLDGYLFSQ